MAAPPDPAGQLQAELRLRSGGWCSWRPGRRWSGSPRRPRRRSASSPIACGSQLVGLSVKSGRSSLIWMNRVRSGIPSRICGSGSETALTCAVEGLTSTAVLTAITPRSYGPETAGTTTSRLSGDAFVGARQVDPAGHVERMRAGTRAGDRGADLAGGGTGRARLLGDDRCSPGAASWSSADCGQYGTPFRVAAKPARVGDADRGHVLVAVVAV